MKLYTPLLNLESLSAILFNRKTLQQTFLTKKLEVSHGPLKTRNGSFLNLEPRWILKRMKEVPNETLHKK